MIESPLESAAPSPLSTHRLNVFQITAVTLALLSFGLTIATSNFDAKLKHSGMTLMMLCISAYVLHLHGRPIAERPPVTFSPFVQRLIVGFCVGTFFCGMGIAGPFGFAMQFLPTVTAIGLACWLTSAAGIAKREQIAARAQRW